MKAGRIVYIPDKNLMGEVISQQLHGAFVLYYEGGFEVTEYLTDEDYEELGDFDEDDG